MLLNLNIKATYLLINRSKHYDFLKVGTVNCNSTFAFVANNLLQIYNQKVRSAASPGHLLF